MIKQFFASYTFTAHSVAAAFAVLILAYSAVPAFHDLVTHIYSILPGWLQETAVALVALYIWYKNNLTQLGVNRYSAKLHAKQIEKENR